MKSKEEKRLKSIRKNLKKS